MAQVNDNILNKIKALFNMANDKSITEDEAVLFMDKAQELLAKYNLDMSDIKDEAEVSTMDKTFINTSYGHIKWRQVLMAAIAKLYFCKGYISIGIKNGKSMKSFVIAGKEHNRLMATSMLDYLEKAVVRLSRNFSSEAGKRYHFESGAGLRLAIRIREKMEEMNKPVSSGSSNLPALYSQELALVDDFLSDMDFKNSQSRSTTSNSATIAGYKAADGISLNNQIGGSKSSFTSLPTGSKFLLS